MEWLNYHHLLYFWTVAKEGSVTRAAETLHLAQPTLSSQIKKLEKSVGHDLFERSGRSLALTETGQLVFRYADEIFGLGRELADVLHNRTDEDKSRFLVGVQGALPKLVAYELLRPALECEENDYQIVCFEGKLNELLGELAMHRLDVVIADRPLTPDNHVRAFNHLLGKCGVTVYGTSKLARKYKKNFPQSPTVFSIRSDKFKYNSYYGLWDTDELFDIQADPDEQNNLIGSPDYQKQSKQMETQLYKMMAELGGMNIPMNAPAGRSNNIRLRGRGGDKAADFPANLVVDEPHPHGAKPKKKKPATK